jgi:hypothetical protein
MQGFVQRVQAKLSDRHARTVEDFHADVAGGLFGEDAGKATHFARSQEIAGQLHPRNLRLLALLSAATTQDGIQTFDRAAGRFDSCTFCVGVVPGRTGYSEPIHKDAKKFHRFG